MECAEDHAGRLELDALVRPSAGSTGRVVPGAGIRELPAVQVQLGIEGAQEEPRLTLLDDQSFVLASTSSGERPAIDSARSTARE